MQFSVQQFECLENNIDRLNQLRYGHCLVEKVDDSTAGRGLPAKGVKKGPLEPGGLP